MKTSKKGSMKINRRDFLQRSSMFMGAVAFQPWNFAPSQAEFPEAEKLGRVTIGRADIRAKPFAGAPTNKVIYDDAVVVWLREVIGESPGGYGSSRWVETPDGYIYAPRLQPCYNRLNAPLKDLPASPNRASPTGKGIWAEVTVPYVDIILRHAPNSPLFKEQLEIGFPPRLYHSMIVWIDNIETNSSGKVMYRINERYGNPGDVFLVPAETLRPLTDDDVSTISPDVENKRVVVNLTRQTLSCYEDGREVYFCQISTGAKFDAQGNAVNYWSTPKGLHAVYRKLVSLHMSGETTGNWPGVGWTQIFATGGVAIHSTYWHNAYGIPRSHGCVNCKPDDAQWIWRWTFPHVGLEPGDIDISSTWPPTGTKVEVIE
jgi:lipoprotein-anchoring transpeptidase ErfK/SrfK